ncbi:MAG: hypothetical protein QXW94_00840 [Desulfurococcaceae archaeon]
MDFKLLYVYGLHPSSLYGNLLLVDALTPPKKCPLGCITCTLGPAKEVAPQAIYSAHVSSLINDVEEFWPKGINIDGILVWGCGDPLLLSNIEKAVSALKDLTSRHSNRPKVLLHTSGINVGNLHANARIVEEVDYFLVPYAWYGDNRGAMGWPPGVDFSVYLEGLKEFSKRAPGKLVVEMLVFRLADSIYPDNKHAEETIPILGRIKPARVVLKPIDRPTQSPHVKPGPESHLTRLEEFLLMQGLEVFMDTVSLPSTTPTWRNTINMLYNQLLRAPLKYAEVRSIYGDLGVISLDNLLSKKLVSRIVWGGSTYFRGSVDRLPQSTLNTLYNN